MHNFLFVFALNTDKIDIVECISYFIIARFNFNQLRENLVLLKIKPICLHLVSLSYVLANVMDIFRYIYDEFDTCEHHFYFPFRKKSRRFLTSTNKTFKLEEGGGTNENETDFTFLRNKRNEINLKCENEL